MRKVTFGGAPSLDGYFARKDDAVDWLMWSKEAATIMSDYWKTIDTIVMGRKTYEAALKMDKGKDNLYSGMKTYVFSRTLKPHKQANVEVFCGDAVQFMKRLKKRTARTFASWEEATWRAPCSTRDLSMRLGSTFIPCYSARESRSFTR